MQPVIPPDPTWAATQQDEFERLAAEAEVNARAGWEYLGDEEEPNLAVRSIPNSGGYAVYVDYLDPLFDGGRGEPTILGHGTWLADSNGDPLTSTVVDQLPDHAMAIRVGYALAKACEAGQPFGGHR